MVDTCSCALGAIDAEIVVCCPNKEGLGIGTPLDRVHTLQVEFRTDENQMSTNPQCYSISILNSISI